MKCAIYYRVSTEDQSVTKQLEELPPFAEKMGWQIHDTYLDDGISGKTIEARPDFKRLFEDMISHKFDILLVEALDRLTRTDDLAERGYIMQTLIDNKIKLWSYREGECDPSDFAGELTSTIKFIMAAEERKAIAKRTIGGKISKMRRGIPCSGGHYPFARSYDKVTGKWSMDERKADLIRQAADEYLKGVSLRKIIADLKAKGEKISYHTILKIFRNGCGDTYTVTFKDKGVTQDFKIPRILDDNTIQALKDRIDFNKTQNRTDIKRFVLNGFVKCAKCGRSLHGQQQKIRGPNGKVFLYYRHPIWKKGQKDPCLAFRSIAAKKIEKGVFDLIFETVGDTPGFRAAIRNSLPDENMIKDLKTKLANDQKALKKVNRDLDKLIDFALKGILNENVIKSRQDELLNSKGLLESNVKHYQDKLNTLPDLEQAEADAEKIRQKLKKKFKSKERLLNMGYDEKREMLYDLFPAGFDGEGQPYGIFVKRYRDGWQYTINALIFDKMRYIDHVDPVKKGREIINEKRRQNYITSKVVVDAGDTPKRLQGCCKSCAEKVQNVSGRT